MKVSTSSCRPGGFVVVKSISLIPLTPETHGRDSVGRQNVPRKFSSRFFVGPENCLLDVVWNAVTQRTSRYNPVVLYGPSGVGKSHFVGALARRFRDHHPDSKTLLIGGEDFARAYASAVELDSISELRNKYHNADFFGLDGLESLAHKPAALMELLYTLDSLRQQGRWVFITANSSPVQLQWLTGGLRSRLIGGLTVPVSTLSDSTRSAVIDDMLRERIPGAARQQVEVSLRNGGRLDQGWRTVPDLRLALQQLLDGLISPACDDQATQERQGSDAPAKQATVREITKSVARYFRLKQSELTGPSRRQGIVHARNVAIYLSRRMTDTSYEKIGLHFGGRDHTTVLHAFQRIASLLDSDAKTQQAIRELTEELCET
jgi:chromosomal replication initiator protein